MILTDFRLLIGAVGILVIGGCGCVHHGTESPESAEPVTVQNTHALTINVLEYRPHCGGMAPTPEMEANMTQPASGAIYYLYATSRLPSTPIKYKKVVANADGEIKIDLPGGSYSMIHPDKLLSLEEFLALKKVEGIHYQHQPDSCYEELKKRADFDIVLKSDSTITFTINHRCFTGTNPCMTYTGPHPP